MLFNLVRICLKTGAVSSINNDIIIRHCEYISIDFMMGDSGNRISVYLVINHKADSIEQYATT